jgi:ribosomal protein S18 acetylase RimI-like enzyme
MAVDLRPMSEDEFAQWWPRARDRDAEDLVRNGGGDLSEEEARRKAAEDSQQLFPGDRPSEGQFVFVIEAEGEPVGELWLSERSTGFGRCLWIWDIRIGDAYRGRGHGRAAMLQVEAEARRRRLSRIGLNVFAGNEIARSLYASLGYAERAIIMSKSI